MLLGIDTSGAVSVAVAEGSLTGPDAPTVLATGADTRIRHHDEVLLALVDDTVARAGGSRDALTGIVAGRGPGPFTGLRVGLVVARTLAAVLDVPLHGLCSLDALAHQALADAGPDVPGGTTVAVALDARRREVYHARYRLTSGADGVAALLREHGPAVDAPAEVAAALTAADHLVGSGTALHPELLPATAELVHVDAGHLLLAAAAAARRGEDLTDTAPLYLREPDAARPTARKSALGRP